MQPGVGGAGVGGTQRVELLDGAIGIDHDQGAGQQPEAFHRTRLAEDELDELAEQADACFLARGGVPALEDGDQPVGVAGAGRRAFQLACGSSKSIAGGLNFSSAS